MNEIDGGLPYVDEHSIRIPVERERVWTALQSYVATSLRFHRGNPLALILGTEPRAGFEVTATSTLERLSLSGRHRFSHYLLRFDLDDDGSEGTLLRATTFAEFPGLHGRVYRGLVIGTGGHAAATRHILRAIREHALRGTSSTPLTD